LTKDVPELVGRKGWSEIENKLGVGSEAVIRAQAFERRKSKIMSPEGKSAVWGKKERRRDKSD